MWTLKFFKHSGQNWLVIVNDTGAVIDTYHPWLLDRAYAVVDWYNDIQSRAYGTLAAAA